VAAMSEASRTEWRVRRLMAMTPAEVGLRLARGVSHRLRRRATALPQYELARAEDVLVGAAGPGEAGGLIASVLEGSVGGLLKGGADAVRLERALADVGVSVDSTVRAAERIMEGFVPAFGWTEIETGREPDWMADPVSGERWPLAFWADVEFRAGGPAGDPRYVWEVNRHHYLVTLARAHALTGEAAFAERVWRDLRGWIEGNPPFFGINWASALEVALRLMSWAMVLDLVGTAGAEAGDAEAVATSVSLQARHLSDNLSVYASSRNNHLIGEAVGLLVAGAKFPFLKGAGVWRRRGAVLLEREIDAQVTPDGVTREQALGYEVFVMELALLGHAAAECAGRPLSSSFLERLRRMARFTGAAAGACGKLPSIGDADGGRAYELSDRPSRQAMAATAYAALLSGCEEPEAAERADLEPAIWLAGPESVASLLAVRGRKLGAGADGSFPGAFPEGGYFVARGAGQHGVIDCGPLGYLSIAAHGHADCLSLSICFDGRWVLVDPGTYCYHRNADWRDHFRSTTAHSTVAVDGLDQSQMLGSFMWGRRANARPLAWAVTDELTVFSGAHDGYVASSGVRHTRTVVLGERGYWIVVDRLDGSGSHRVDALFQLAEGFSTDGDLVFTDDGGRSVRITSWVPDGMDVDVVEGREQPRGGWVSGGFGHRAAAPAVVARGQVELPATLCFALVPFRGESQVSVARSTDCSGDGAAFDVDVSGARGRVLVGRVERAANGERFRGVLGFETARGGTTSRAGIDVEEWTAGGVDVVHDRIENVINA
jgi:hypothetical protein